jgi:toxin YoeB
MADADRLAIGHPEFLDDLQHWVEQDRRTARRLMQLMKAVMRDPFDGIGKPEPLRHLGSGVWSRRITQEHRLVYVVRDAAIEFLQGRYYY